MSQVFLLAISGLVNGVCALALGFFVITRNPHSSLHRVYACFCGAIAIWGFGYFCWLNAANAEAALFWSKVLMAGAMFIPPTAFHHLLKLIGREVPRAVIWGTYVLSAVLSFNLGGLVVLGVEQEIYFRFAGSRDLVLCTSFCSLWFLPCGVSGFLNASINSLKGFD
jgi:hypothetical protein